MSATEIMAELPKLSRGELEAIEARLTVLLDRAAPSTNAHWGHALRDLAGTVQELPADYATNHDHYLHGAPKR